MKAGDFEVWGEQHFVVIRMKEVKWESYRPLSVAYSIEEYLLNIYTDVSEESATLKMGAALFSAMSASINQTTRCHVS